jgi:ribosomal protein S27AE
MLSCRNPLNIKNGKHVQKPLPEKGRQVSESNEVESDREPINNQDQSSEPYHKARRGLKFCPRCGSNDVFFASGLPHLWSLWDCRTCGYRGAFILEDGKLALKLAEEYQKGKR